MSGALQPRHSLRLRRIFELTELVSVLGLRDAADELPDTTG